MMTSKGNHINLDGVQHFSKFNAVNLEQVGRI